MKRRATVKPFEDRMLDVLGDPRGVIYRERGVWYYMPSDYPMATVPLGFTRKDVARRCAEWALQTELPL